VNSALINSMVLPLNGSNPGVNLQLTPTAKLSPDLQVIWNPTYNPVARQSVIFQLQLDINW